MATTVLPVIRGTNWTTCVLREAVTAEEQERKSAGTMRHLAKKTVVLQTSKRGKAAYVGTFVAEGFRGEPVKQGQRQASFRLVRVCGVITSTQPQSSRQSASQHTTLRATRQPHAEASVGYDVNLAQTRVWVQSTQPLGAAQGQSAAAPPAAHLLAS